MSFFNPDKSLPRLIILRGVSGAGKSTIANILKQCAGYSHYEADMYFMKFDEKSRRLVYKFDPQQLSQAHAWCLDKTKEALAKGAPGRRRQHIHPPLGVGALPDARLVLRDYPDCAPLGKRVPIYPRSHKRKSGFATGTMGAFEE